MTDTDEELSARAKEFFDMATTPVELDLELRECLVYYDSTDMWAIKHKFVNEMFYTERFHSMYNERLRYKQKAAEDAFAEEDWTNFVFIHERPWRLEALVEIANCVESDADWWSLVARVWVDSENIREWQSTWDTILNMDRPGQNAMMDEDDQKALAAMPETITIFQGCTDVRDDGWSWTTKRETAEWFANRFANLERGEPMLRMGRVRKENVLAYITNRNESEILVDPEMVDVYRTVTPKGSRFVGAKKGTE